MLDALDLPHLYEEAGIEHMSLFITFKSDFALSLPYTYFFFVLCNVLLSLVASF